MTYPTMGNSFRTAMGSTVPPTLDPVATMPNAVDLRPLTEKRRKTDENDTLISQRGMTLTIMGHDRKRGTKYEPRRYLRGRRSTNGSSRIIFKAYPDRKALAQQ